MAGPFDRTLLPCAQQFVHRNDFPGAHSRSHAFAYRVETCLPARGLVLRPGRPGANHIEPSSGLSNPKHDKVGLIIISLFSFEFYSDFVSLCLSMKQHTFEAFAERYQVASLIVPHNAVQRS